jgi:hypothetical protein
MATTKNRVMYAADTAKPYLGRALQDEDFRENLRAAFAAARAIYEELSRQRGVSGIAATAATDEEIHSNLRRSIKELQHAADRLQGRRVEKSHTFRNVMLVFAGITIGVFFNPFTGPAARRWVTGKAGGSADGYSPNGTT